MNNSNVVIFNDYFLLQRCYIVKKMLQNYPDSKTKAKKYLPEQVIDQAVTILFFEYFSVKHVFF